ncbi:unnamed protein product [Vitrella brassicaformis CCMP3155]|uniref:Disease resistance R13L4/SHOC-2-like LRR domain-containing protein n=1 Tax=Vitrella brassicaformis (strain CCMP3155) TaxID=1169540 RepID=A0A0G4FRH6_VITBC|nr:unnamed protein product [Vitrella brassicaformis CCMP3155]|eukprot:CEM16697.1 unnamed protein product [Vitrella brassicaformis CCMP3155]
MQRGDNILPYTEMEELMRCDLCQEDAAALFAWSYEAGLVDNGTESTFEDNLCVVPFITCVRLREALADGGPQDGYIINLTGRPEDMDVSDVPQILQQRGAPLVFSEVFYRLRHVVCFWAAMLAMQGSLGDDIAKVTSLRAFYLFEVDGFEGPLPSTIGELPYLKGLYIMNMASISRPIPPSLTSLPIELGGWKSMEVLDLYNNNFSGPIPAELGQLSKLRRLSLGSNRLSGLIPAELEQLSKLRQLYLARNRLSGPIPTELGQLSKLRQLSLRNNSLSGPIPAELGQLSKLRQLSLENNSVDIDICSYRHTDINN